MSRKPRISVCMISYNHESFIERAISGILEQICQFEIELIISDDYSQDKTASVIEHSIKNRSGNHKLKFLRNSENIGMIPNFISALKQCKGDYIALCDGDDYWTDPLKLQKQVTFLETNKEFRICFHPVMLWDESLQQLRKDTITREVSDVTDIKDLAQGNYIHTPSVMLRNDFVLPDWFKKTPQGDWSLYMLMLGHGKIKKLPDTMAVYRVHGESLWSSKSTQTRQSLTQKSYQLLYDNGNFDETIKELLYARLNKKINNKTEYRGEYRGKYFLKRILSFFKN